MYQQKPKQLAPTASEPNSVERPAHRVVYVLPLLICELASLFIAGIAVPTLLESLGITNHAVTAGSVHHLVIAHVAFSWKFRNLAVALVGALFGTAIASAMAFPKLLTGNVLQILHKRWGPTRKQSEGAYVHKLA